MKNAAPAAGGRTPIIISGGSITVQSLLMSGEQAWEKYRLDHQTFAEIPVTDASVLQFFPSSASGTEPSETYELDEGWKVVVFVKDSSKTQQLEVRGHPGKKFTVWSSHTFSNQPHTAFDGYDGRSFCDCEGADPGNFHIDETVIVSGLLDPNKNRLPDRTFHCSDVTCHIHIGAPQK
jgi:hypothetical protein